MSCRSTGNWFVGYVSPYALRRVMTDSTNLTGTTWLDYRALLTSVSRVQVVILISLMVLVALSEGISFLMLVPMLNTMLGPDSVPHPMLVDFGGIRFSVPLYALLIGFVALVKRPPVRRIQNRRSASHWQCAQNHQTASALVQTASVRWKSGDRRGHTNEK